jgi:hypothetical protein
MASNNNKEIIRLEKKHRNLLNDPNSDVSAGAALVLSCIEGVKKQISYRRIGGRVTAKIRTEDALLDKKIIHTEASDLLKDGKGKKDIAGIIVTRKKYSSSKVYRALKSHPSKKWNK